MRHPRNVSRLFLAAALFASLPGLAADVKCLSIEVSSGPSFSRGNTIPLFSATQVIDLTLRAQTSQNIKGDHALQFRVFTPAKAIYQTIDVPVVDPAAAAGTRKLQGYPFAVPEKKPTRSVVNGAMSYAVDASLPVGGTAIVARGLYGIWTVDATWDGAPFCSAQQFRINP